MYQSLGWDLYLVRLVNKWFFMHEAVTKDALQSINEHKAQKKQTLKDAADLWIKKLVQNGSMVTLQESVWLGILILFSALYFIRWKTISLMAALRPWVWLAAYLTEMLYFAWNGRVVQRVMEAILFLTMIPSLLDIACALENSIPEKWREKGLRWFPVEIWSICAVVAVGLFLITPLFKTSPWNKVFLLRNDRGVTYRRNEMEAYAIDHPNTLFIYDYGLSPGGSPWTVYPKQKPTNLIFWGGSGYNSPLYYKQLRANGYDTLYADVFLGNPICIMGRTTQPEVFGLLSAYMSATYPGSVYETETTGKGFSIYRFFGLSARELRAAGDGDASVELCWEAVEKAERYKVSRLHLGDKKWTDLPETADVSCMDDTVIPGETYLYRLTPGYQDQWGGYAELEYRHTILPELSNAKVFRVGSNGVLVDCEEVENREGAVRYAWYVYKNGKRMKALDRGYQKSAAYLLSLEEDGRYCFRCFQKSNGGIHSEFSYYVVVQDGKIADDSLLTQISEEEAGEILLPPAEVVMTRLSDRTLKLTIKDNRLDAGQDYTYAWYVYRNGDRLRQYDRKYAADPAYELTLELDGEYRFKLFYRKDGESQYIMSDIITIGDSGS